MYPTYMVIEIFYESMCCTNNTSVLVAVKMRMCVTHNRCKGYLNTCYLVVMIEDINRSDFGCYLDNRKRVLGGFEILVFSGLCQ